MSKTLAILLLLIFSVTQTEFGQLLKIPFLFEHYSKHHRQNHTLSFIDFLKDHYSKEHKDGDKTEDRKLPFLSAMSQSSGIAIVPLAILLQKPVKSVCKQFCLLNDPHDLPQVFHSIFHPPQRLS
jgi:hypothetical protein